MNKYIVLFFIGILIFEITFFVSLNFFEENNEEFVESELNKVNEIEEIAETEETSIDEEKVGINTELVIEESYSRCKHKTETITEVDSDMINLTEDEFEDAYPKYEVEEFSKEKIIVHEEKDGICDEHFNIALGEDFIEVFKLNSNEEEELYLVTNISRDYLTADDIEKLDLGISVYGRDNINSKLEDYE